MFRVTGRATRGLFSVALSTALSGCALLASSGPSLREVEHQHEGKRVSEIRLIDVDVDVARRLRDSGTTCLFSKSLDPGVNPIPVTHTIGPGDVLGITVWEAPPAALFSPAALSGPVTTPSGTVTNFPNQMVEADGSIEIPFAGSVSVGGKSPKDVDLEIERRLKSTANQPQVLVQIAVNNSANVTVVGAVTQSVRMPLTPKGERLLDAIAAAGGVNQPINKVAVQITRGPKVCQLALDMVIQLPSENIPLAPNDVVTLLFQPQYFTVLGAVANNAEVSFEAQGISLVQAMARSGGLVDSRADARGVFLFRFENPNALSDAERAGATTADGKVPVIYRLNLKDPAAFLVAQDFPMQNKDILYVANAPASELQKFLNILTSSIYSVNSLVNLSP